MRYDENVLTDQTGRILLRSFCSTVPEGDRKFWEHHHAECELSTVLSGSGIYRVQEKDYSFSPGDVFLFHGEEVHCLTKVSGSFSLLNIRFEPRLLWTDADEFSALQILFARNDRFENRIDSKNPKTAWLHDEIIALHEELKRQQDGFQLMTKYKLFSMLITLVRSYDYVDRNAGYMRFQATVSPMKHALSYMEENLDKPLRLADIAAEAAMSPAYFSVMFKKMNGLTPWEYLSIKRVERAISLLKSSNQTKLEIALSCGFSSSSNFYKIFKRITGKNPGDYQL